MEIKRLKGLPETLVLFFHLLLHLQTTQTTPTTALDNVDIKAMNFEHETILRQSSPSSSDEYPDDSEDTLSRTDSKTSLFSSIPKTVQNQSRVCPIGHFECKVNFLLCVPQAANCNGKPDCPNGSDEVDCQDPHLKGEWDWAFIKRPDEDAEKHNGSCFYTQGNAPNSDEDYTLGSDSVKAFSTGESPVSSFPVGNDYKPRRASSTVSREEYDSDENDMDKDFDSNLNFDTYWLSKGCICANERLFCQNLKLSDLKFLPLNLEFLDLSGSIVQKLDFHFPNLHTLVLSGCFIEDIIGPGAFSFLPKLNILYLTDNRLRYIPNGAFAGGSFNTSSIRRLFLDYNQISVLQPKSFEGLTSLMELNLKHNQLTGREVGVFKPLKSMLILHLNNNRMESLRKNFLLGLSKLETLTLSGNQISYIEMGAFENLPSLKQLYLNWNKLKILEDRGFCNLRKLLTLNLRGNEISEIRPSAFDCLDSLTSLNVEKNRFGEINRATRIFQNLTTLNYIYFDNFWMCSWAYHVRSCEPKGDGISSVKNLLDNVLLRVCVWIMGLLSVLGNFFVIFCRIILREPNRVHSFYIRNLAAADLLMGFFLISIAIHDLSYRGQFLTYQYAWRHSLTCQLSGLLSTWSSESSVLILSLITLDRYVSIVQPFAEKTTSLHIAAGICIFLWVVSFLLSSVPLSGIFAGYFGTGFYTGNGLCLPLHIHNPYDKGWEYSFLLFVVLNSLAFLFICFAYVRMLRVIQRSTLMIRSNQQKQDSLLAKRFALVVLTDFICWAPIVIAKLVAMAGVAIPSELYAWLAVFALPVNSALNPIIYTLTTKLFKQQVVKMTRGFHTRIFRRGGPMDDSSVSLSLFRYRTTRTANTSLAQQSIKHSRGKVRGSPVSIHLHVKVPLPTSSPVPIMDQSQDPPVTTTAVTSNGIESNIDDNFVGKGMSTTVTTANSNILGTAKTSPSMSIKTGRALKSTENGQILHPSEIDDTTI